MSAAIGSGQQVYERAQTPLDRYYGPAEIVSLLTADSLQIAASLAAAADRVRQCARGLFATLAGRIALATALRG